MAEHYDEDGYFIAYQSKPLTERGQEQDTRPSWCGLPAKDRRVDRAAKQFLGEWERPNGPIARCSEECRDARKREGKHLFVEPSKNVMAAQRLRSCDDKRDDEIARLKKLVLSVIEFIYAPI